MIELLITVIVLGILAAIAIPIYSAQVEEGVRATLKSDIIQTAGQVGVHVGKANENQAFTYNPCASASTFNLEMKVQSDPDNLISCVYYGNTAANTASEKRQAYNSYEWCVQGERADIGDLWNFNSRTKTLTEGSCVRVGGTTGQEAIG